MSSRRSSCSVCRGRAWECAAGLEESLEIGEHLRPAARYALEHLRVQVVMRNRQSNESVGIRLDIECNARVLRLVPGFTGSGPSKHQPAWRAVLDDLAHYVHRARGVDARVFPP